MRKKYKVVKVTKTRRQTEQLHPNVEYQIHGYVLKDGKWLLSSKENIVKNQELNADTRRILYDAINKEEDSIEKKLQELKKDNEWIRKKLDRLL